MSLMEHSHASLFRAIGVSAAVALVAVLGSGVLFVATHRSSSAQSEDSAGRKIQQLLARFGNEEPLLDMEQRRARTGAAAARNHARLHTFHTVIFDTRGSQRLVHMSVPYWWVRTYTRRGELRWLGQLTFLDDTEFDPEPIRLSLDEIERHGPGLIAYCRHPSGGQFVSWVE